MNEACRVVADVHGQADWLVHALGSTTLPVVLLGDLVDRGPDSPGALRVALSAIETGRATLIRSNHDDKLHRVLLGRKPQIGPDLASTLAALDAAPDGADLKLRFLRAYAAAPWWIVRGQHVLLHGAFAPEMLQFSTPEDAPAKPLRSKLTYLALYAEGRMEAGQALPTRTYRWLDGIPSGLTVIAGHDVRSREAPLVATGAAGGRAIFLDTGAGAGGRLSWIDLPDEQIGQIG